MFKLIYFTLASLCTTSAFAAQDLIFGKIDPTQSAETMKICLALQPMAELENQREEMRIKMEEEWGKKIERQFIPHLGKYTSLKIDPSCFPLEKDEKTPDILTRAEFLQKMSINRSLNYNIQLYLQVAEEMINEYTQYLPNIDIFQKVNRGFNAFSAATLSGKVFPSNMNYDYIVGRSFAMKPTEYKGYEDIRRNFFTQDYLTVENLSFFQGYLVTPQSKEGKKSAGVVLMPSTGNIGPIDMLHAESLASNGIIAFIVDPYYSGNKVGGLTNPMESLLENELMVAFAARHLLSTHPHVDSSKIGIGGFSRGGTSADMASRQEIYQTLAHDKKPFAFHYAYYPSIIAQQIKLNVAGPILYLTGSKDEFVDVESMRAYCKRLGDAGVKADMIIYKNSYHSFDNLYQSEEPEVVNFPVLSMKNAGVAYEVNRGFTPLKEGKMPEEVTSLQPWNNMFDYLSQNAAFSYTTAYNPKHTQHALQRVIEFINTSTK